MISIDKIMPIFVIVNALLPIFAVILAGIGFRRYNFPGAVFWPSAERLTYFVLFPSLLLKATSTASIGSLSVMPLVYSLLCAIAVMVVLLLVVKPKLPVDASAFSSVFQGSIRFNTYVGFAVAYALFGNEGLTWSAVTIALLIPLVNMISVIIIVLGNDDAGWSNAMLATLKTPPFVACMAGIALNVLGIELPVAIQDVLKLFGRASLPLGLLTVGAGLELTNLGKNKIAIVFPVVMKLCVLPIFMWIGCEFFSVQHVAKVIAILFAALPGSASSYILARQLGGDSTLMAAIVTVQVAASLFTLPLVLSLLSP